MQMKVNKKIFIPAVLVLVTVLVLIVANLTAVQNAVSSAYDFCIKTFGWFFVATNILCLIFSAFIMFGPYRNVRLGGETAVPEFGTISWAGMMFTTSCGAWLVVYGFLEPIYCASQTPFQIEPLTTEAYEVGQMYAHFHWGPNAWCIYVPVTIAIAYAIYNRKARKTSISEVCKTADIGAHLPKVVKKGFFGELVDIIAVIATIIAPVISVGTGMPLLTALIERIFGISHEYKLVIQFAILLIWMVIFGASIFMGLNKGIKRLSNINLKLAFVFMIVFGILVGLTKMFSAEINTIGLFITNFVRMSTYTEPWSSGSFVQGWTWSYWACYFVYMPLMGVFNAKISKGRKLKEVAFGQLVLCSLGCWVAMATFGNYAMKLQVETKLDIAAYLSTGDEAGAILAIMNQVPAPLLMMIFLLVISFVFLATTMDSSAFAAAEMTTLGETDRRLAPRWLRIFWAGLASCVAFVMLQVGGVKAIRSLCYIAGLPLAVVTYFLVWSVIKMLKEDYKSNKEVKQKL